MKKIIPILLSLVFVLSGFCGCSNEQDDNRKFDDVEAGGEKYVYSDEITDYVCITMADGGKILIELRPDAAPVTVKNFQKLVSEHFYDGLIFHRVIENFMIQGGDPHGNGTRGSGSTIYGEFAANGYDNPLSHVRGTVSMARPAKDMDGASSQFFICHADFSRSGDGMYAAFGTVIYGMDTVDKIAVTEVNPYNDKPISDQVMESVRFYKKADK